MYKYISTFTSVLVVLSLSAPSCWAQRFLKPMPKPSQIMAAQRAGVVATSRQMAHLYIVPVKKAPLIVITQSPEIIALRIERQLAFQRMNQKAAEKARVRKQAKKAAQLAQEKNLANATPLGVVNTTSQPGAIVFRGTQIGEVNPGESLLMAGAYTRNGRQAADFRYNLPNGKNIPISRLEEALEGYDISRIVVAVRTPATETTPKSLRIIDYDVEFGIIDNSGK